MKRESENYISPVVASPSFSASLLASRPIESPCTTIENNTTIYVIETNISPYIYFGTDKARATEIPPRKAPHVSMGIVIFANDFLYRNSVIGSHTEIKRPNNTMTTVIQPSANKVPLNGMMSISNPINKNKDNTSSK